MPDTLDEMRNSTIKHIIGPTILLGSGSYFDYEAPEQTPLAIEDYAYGIAGANRFASQSISRFTGRRVFYNVAQHCVLMSHVVQQDPEFQPGDDYDALMHEGGEPVCGDMVGPLKSLCSDYKKIEKRCEAASHGHFGVRMRDPILIKRWDLRMLATEKRDLCPKAADDEWRWLRGEGPVPGLVIEEVWDSYDAAERFLDRFHELRGRNG